MMTLAMMVLLAAVCSQPASESKPQAAPTTNGVSHKCRRRWTVFRCLRWQSTPTRQPGPYSVWKPVDLRAVVTTRAMLTAQFRAAGGTTRPEYVVALRGRFTCGCCGAAMLSPATTTDPSEVQVSTMVLQVPAPLADWATTGVTVGVGTPVMAELGQACDLDLYTKSLTRVPVPPGPLYG